MNLMRKCHKIFTGTIKSLSRTPEARRGCNSLTDSIMHSDNFGWFLEHTFIEFAKIFNKNFFLDFFEFF